MSNQKDIAGKLIDNLARASDLVLVAGGDGEKFPVIRKVIAESSKYFEVLLGPNFKEGTEAEIVLKGIDGPTLKAIIYYIYAGDIELTKDNIASVLHAASGMELPSLAEDCGRKLAEIMAKENCVTVVMLADRYGFAQLRTTALQLVCTHFENISKTDILQMDGNILVDLLKCEHFEAPESKIFEYLVDWVQQNELERAKFMPDLLQSIHLEYMPGEYIHTTVKPIFEHYGLSEILQNEYQKRLLESQHTRSSRYLQSESKSIYYAESGSSPKINIYKYDSQWEEFKTVAHDISRSNFSWAFNGKNVYIFGGHVPGQKVRYSDKVEMFEVGTWRRKTLQKMKKARTDFSTVAYNGYIYIFGGRNSTGCLNECERFCTTYNSWCTLSPMPCLLYNSEAIEVNGKIYITGGYDKTGNDSNAIFCYFNATWTAKTYLNGKIGKIVLAKSNDLLYVFANNTLHTYDTSTDTWLEVRSFSSPNLTILKTIDYFGHIYALYQEERPHPLTPLTKFGRCLSHGEWKIDSPVDVGEDLGTNGYPGILFVY